jgi:MacB-like protein
MPSTRIAGAVAVMSLLALGACGDYACSILESERRFPEPPATSYDAATFQIQIQTPSEAVEGARVTPEFLRITAVRALLGRALVAEDYTPRSTEVVMISHDWWKTRLEGAPDTIGKTIQIDGQPAVIVGVAEPSFRIPKSAKLWIPKRLP